MNFSIIFCSRKIFYKTMINSYDKFLILNKLDLNITFDDLQMFHSRNVEK